MTIQDIVFRFRQNTTGRVSLLAGLLLLGLLAACSSGGTQGNERAITATAAQQASATAAATATAAPPTATPSPTFTPSPTPTPTPPAPLAAQVNGQYIFLADYERRVAQFEQSLRGMGLDPDTAEGQAQLAQARADILEGMIDEALIAQGAEALGVTVSEEELETQLQADIEAGGGQAAFDEWLTATGQTAEEYKEMLRRALLSRRVWEAVTADVPAAVEQVHVRVIALDSQEEALAVLDLLRQGEDFAALARERSLDVATQGSGGDLGWFPRGVVDPALENAAFALQPGQVSDPLPLGERYYLVQLVEREEARSLPDDLLWQMKQSKFDQWLEDLRAAAVIERFITE